MKRTWTGAALCALALSAVTLLAAAAAAGHGPAHVDNARMLQADANPGQWMGPGRTYDEQRYSPLTQINEKTVSKLGLAWYADLDADRGMEASPLEIDGVLYNITPWNITTAYDAKTGRKLWTYDPKVPEQFGRLACCDIVSRGLAAWKGKIIIATLDGRLIALDARNGKPVWTTQTFDKSLPYTVTGAPRVFDGKVLIGNGGADVGPVRGYVTAYDADTGKQLWRFFTVPGDPAKGFENKAMAMAAKTWTGEWWKIGGGGTAWDSIVYDPKLKLIYIGVGNGDPWVQKYRSPGGGDNLFLTSIVAVHADNGQYAWHYQEVNGEEWDYTATQPMILADLKIKGRDRKVIMQAPKDGFFYVLDRATGKLISAEKYVSINWADHIDMKTGRPVENPAVRYGETPVRLSPGAGGGHNFNPMAFSPKTGLVYFPVVETNMAYAAQPSYTPAFRSGNGMNFSAGYEKERQAIAEYTDAHLHAWLTAWDPVKQKEVWRVDFPRNGSGGVLATAGNLIFEGTINKTLEAYRATDGKRLWEGPAQNVGIAAPITYSVGGEQYVALNVGWGGGLAHVESFRFKDLALSKSRLLVFKLGGTASLPPFDDKPVAAIPPPPNTATAEQIAAGETLFAKNCAICHGGQARGGIKDLRQMTPETHAQFLDIVLGGKRASKGMASFADVLSKADAEAIHGYIVKRANQDWTLMGYK
jgi:quinohemoprotein ethanol dehydrogenase